MIFGPYFTRRPLSHGWAPVIQLNSFLFFVVLFPTELQVQKYNQIFVKIYTISKKSCGFRNFVSRKGNFCPKSCGFHNF